MSNVETPEARELSLVGKVEMRIALANDASLGKTLNTYLAPLLLKLASDYVSVRNKVSMESSGKRATIYTRTKCARTLDFRGEYISLLSCCWCCLLLLL